jgi:hypothetical protein
MAETAHLLKKPVDRHIQHISPGEAMKTASRDSGEATESSHFGFIPFFSRKTERLNVDFQRLNGRNYHRDRLFQFLRSIAFFCDERFDKSKSDHMSSL